MWGIIHAVNDALLHQPTVNGIALDNLANDSGVFAGTAAKRVQYGADLVFLFRPLNAITQTTCGTTYLEMADGQAANKGLGYGIISDGHSQDAMANSYCAISTFTHGGSGIPE